MNQSQKISHPNVAPHNAPKSWQVVNRMPAKEPPKHMKAGSSVTGGAEPVTTSHSTAYLELVCDKHRTASDLAHKQSNKK